MEVAENAGTSKSFKSWMSMTQYLWDCHGDILLLVTKP
jgi:hypothetical protein